MNADDKSWIELPLYSQIVDRIPIACVDILPVNKHSFLLSKRKNQPGKDGWYPVGGRIYKGETLVDAAVRKVREELGILCAEGDISLLTTEESIFSGNTTDENRHSVNIIFILHTDQTEGFSFDQEQISEVRWFSTIQRDWHPYVRNLLEAAGFSYE